MAYNKRNWKARQGTGLNFFSIDGATPVPIVNQPTTLTEAGDALSAGNLNDWEQRIADGFDSASGELADAVEELESEDTALKSAITANSNRIANLEQKAGDYSIVQYRGTNAVPTGKAKYGLVKSIVGKTRAWNQLVQNGNFASTSGWESSGATISASNNVLSFTASAQGGFVSFSSGNAVRFNKNDILLATFMIKGTSSTTIQYTCQNNNYIFNESVSVTTSWKQVTLRSDSTGADTHGYIFFFDNRESGWDTIYIKEVCIYNLTLIFGAGNEPSTVADALAQLSALGQYNAYDAGSLVDTEVSGVKSVGVNIWDEEWEVGDYNSVGEKQTSSTKIRTKNFIPVIPNAVYFLDCDAISSSLYMNAFFYDEEKRFVTHDFSGGYFNNTFAVPDGCCYLRFNMPDSYGTTYNHDIQICLNSYADKTTYHPYKTDTLSLPETVTLRCDGGSVSDELDVESGEIVRNCIEIDLTTLTQSGVLWIGADNVAYPYGTNNVIMFCSNPKYTRGNWNTIGSVNNEIAVSSSGMIALCLLDTSETPTGKIVIRRYEPTTESIDPILDNTILTEGGGTVETIQTQSPVIDNCLDVGYLAV